MRYGTVLLIALFSLATLGVAEAKLYKWVDANGKVHYSDRLPPEAAGATPEVKATDGRTVDRVEAPPTKEELEAAERARQAELERQRKEAKQAESDRILLLTFTSAAEMERARDDRVAALESRIQLHQSRIGKLQEEIDNLGRRVAHIERSGRGSTDELYRQIDAMKRQIEENEAFIAASQAEQETIRQTFAKDIERFRQLKAEE